MSATDPKKCCRVLLTWELKYNKYELWKQYKPASVPPNTRAVPGTVTATLNQRARAILNNVPKIPGSLIPDGQSSPRNIDISLDSEAVLQNLSEFEGKRIGEGLGKTDPVVGLGTCKRLTPKASKTCNCMDFTNGTLVPGSEICTIPDIGSEELGPDAEQNNDNPSTTSLTPRYKCKGTVKWEQYRPRFGWSRESKDIDPVTFAGPRIPTKVTKGRTITDVCTVKHKKEMDCCL